MNWKDRFSNLNVVVLDCDGVLLNYNAAYPGVWKKAFNEPLPQINPHAYHAAAEYGAVFASQSHKERFYAAFDAEAWSTMPALPGALEACKILVEKGLHLVCVSSMPPEFANARQKNLYDLGFPIDTVIATGRVEGRNPKLEVLREIAPVAFADDLADNFYGIDWPMHKALIDYGQDDSPNRNLDLAIADTHHASLLDFAKIFVITN